MAKHPTQADNFSLDVQAALQDNKDLRTAFQESIASYPGWVLEGDNTLLFPDGSKATLTPEGLKVE